MPHRFAAFLPGVPWLMLATTMRIIYATDDGIVRHGAFFLANVAILLAFLVVAHQTIVCADGRTEIGTLSFARQIGIARKVILRITLLLAFLSLTLTWLGAPRLAAHVVYGFDGIAFDQFSSTGFVLSAFLAPLVLLMVLAGERGGRAVLLLAGREFAARWRSLLPAVAVSAAFLFALSAGQGVVREFVQEIWQTPWVPYFLRALLYFFFIFSFATLRLYGILAIVVFALRQSYLRGEGPSQPSAVTPGR